MSDLVFAISSGTRLDRDGNPTSFTTGEAWSAQSQFVKDNVDLFATEPNVVRGLPDHGPSFAQRVERAVRRPGTRR